MISSYFPNPFPCVPSALSPLCCSSFRSPCSLLALPFPLSSLLLSSPPFLLLCLSLTYKIPFKSCPLKGLSNQHSNISAKPNILYVIFVSFSIFFVSKFLFFQLDLREVVEAINYAAQDDRVSVRGSSPLSPSLSVYSLSTSPYLSNAMLFFVCNAQGLVARLEHPGSISACQELKPALEHFQKQYECHKLSVFSRY